VIPTAPALRGQGRDCLNAIDIGMMLGSPGPPVSLGPHKTSPTDPRDGRKTLFRRPIRGAMMTFNEIGDTHGMTFWLGLMDQSLGIGLAAIERSRYMNPVKT
jgi:hypothetical protein